MKHAEPFDTAMGQPALNEDYSRILQSSYKKNMKKSCLNKLHAIHELLIGYPWKLFIDF